MYERVRSSLMLDQLRDLLQAPPGRLTLKADGRKVSVEYANGKVRTKRRSLFGSSIPGPALAPNCLCR